MLKKHPSENAPYFHLIFSILSLMFCIFAFYFYVTFAVPIESDFINKQFTLKEFSWDEERNTYSIFTEEHCSEFYIRGNKNFSSKSFIENIVIGETINCKIKNKDTENLKNCKKIMIWGISKKHTIYLQLNETIKDEVSGNTIIAPILAIFFLFSSMYLFSVYSITRKYNKI